MMSKDECNFKYDFAHQCEYMRINDDNDSDEKYREEMLKVFGMETFEEDVMVNYIEQLYKLVNEDEQFMNICTKSANRYCLQDLSMGLILLFSCDSFHLIHKCLQDFNNSGKIETEHYNSVLKYLEN